MADRRASERKGRLAEAIALMLMRLKGYRRLAQRFKASGGEVDLIMRRGKTTVFIEVKARPTRDEALTAVTERQRHRISAAARQWMARDPKASAGFCRFDIIAVSAYLWPTHIENAFEGDH